MIENIKTILLSGLVAFIFTIPFQILAVLFVFAFCKFVDRIEILLIGIVERHREKIKKQKMK